MRPIDPVKLREAQEKAATRVRALSKLETSSKALLWFHRSGTKSVGNGPREVDPTALIPSDSFGGDRAVKLIVATATTGAPDAEEYVRRSYIEQRGSILERAIEMAQMDLAEAEEAMK